MMLTKAILKCDHQGCSAALESEPADGIPAHVTSQLYRDARDKLGWDCGAKNGAFYEFCPEHSVKKSAND
jgi:hypothetical protein